MLPPDRGSGGSHTLAFRPPFDWDWILAFLGQRLIAGVEQIDAGVYRRIVRMPLGSGWVSGWLAVQCLPDRPALSVALAPALAPVAPAVLARVAYVFDLGCDPPVVNAVLGELAHDAPGVRVPGAFDGFELAVRAILGQQVTVKAAHTLAGRLAMRFGEPVAVPATPPRSDAPVPLSRVFPDAQRIAALDVADLTACGLIRTRAAAILALANAIVGENLVLSPQAPVVQTVRQLLGLRGIGDWTAQYIAMRALACRDAFPAADLILMRALQVRTPAQAIAAAQCWQPWRAYAVMHLWRRASADSVARSRSLRG